MKEPNAKEPKWYRKTFLQLAPVSGMGKPPCCGFAESRPNFQPFNPPTAKMHADRGRHQVDCAMTSDQARLLAVPMGADTAFCFGSHSQVARRLPLSALLVKNHTPTAPAMRHCPMAMFRACDKENERNQLSNQTSAKNSKTDFRPPHYSKRKRRAKPWQKPLHRKHLKQKPHNVWHYVTYVTYATLIRLGNKKSPVEDVTWRWAPPACIAHGGIDQFTWEG